MIKVAPSILAADFSNLVSEVKRIEDHADALHLDVMDGHFVPNITFGMVLFESLRKITKLPFEAHLMIDKPSRYIQQFSEAGSDMITVHIESEKDIMKVIRQIRRLGKKPAIAINPSTPAKRIEKIISEVDMVLVMTANPGFAGQKFMNSMLPKIRQIKKMINGRDIDIGVDCGINAKTASISVKAGANYLVASSHIFRSRDPKSSILELRRL